METSVKSVDSIARMQDFLPFVLASLRAAKILLSLNLFVLILNCDPLLGQWTLLRQASFTFCTQFPCPSGLRREVITIECWDVGLLVFWKKAIFFYMEIVIAISLKFFILIFLFPFNANPISHVSIASNMKIFRNIFDKQGNIIYS